MSVKPEHPQRPRARLQHRSRGRARARLEPGPDRMEQMQRAKRRLQSEPGITGVEISPRTGSVLVLGDRDELIDAALHQAFQLISSLEKAEPSDRAIATLVDAVSEADRQFLSMSGGRVSLRWIVPAMFVGAGVRKLLADGLTLGNVPWYVLLYYGVDSFLKLNPEHSPQADSREPRG